MGCGTEPRTTPSEMRAPATDRSTYNLRPAHRVSADSSQSDRTTREGNMVSMVALREWQRRDEPRAAQASAPAALPGVSDVGRSSDEPFNVADLSA